MGSGTESGRGINYWGLALACCPDLRPVAGLRNQPDEVALMPVAWISYHAHVLSIPCCETSMRGALLSIVLVGVGFLAACAAGGSRTHDADPIEVPDRMHVGQPAIEQGFESDTGLNAADDSAADLLAYEVTGLERADSATQQRSFPIDSAAFDAGVLYAMAYLPSASGVETERANGLAELYADARPGYDLYTFILGGPIGQALDAEAASYQELLRVIDTYVLGDTGDSDTGSGQHGFLIQVDPQTGVGVSGIAGDARQSANAGLEDASLAQRVRPELSLQMQFALARQLRMFGQVELADRLEQSNGPFLVTSLRPALIPVSEHVPLLIVDLQDLGPEYMYSLVDAYDRPIPGDSIGRPESLLAIGRRVQRMFPDHRLDRGAEPPPAATWIWLIGAPGQTNAFAATSSEES